MDKYISKIEKVISKEKCNDLIAKVEKSEMFEWSKKFGYFGTYGYFTDKKYNWLLKVMDEHIVGYSEKHKFLHPKYNQNPYYKKWGMCESFNIQKYEPGQFYALGEHMEHGRSEVCAKRLLAWMIYLNDIKKEGGTCWPQQEYVSVPRAGDMYIWPAGWTHSHYGIAAPEETKYLLTGWCTF